jgi:hypothetical protein
MPSYWERRADEARRRRLAAVAGRSAGVPRSFADAARLRSEAERAPQSAARDAEVREAARQAGVNVGRFASELAFGPERTSVVGGEAPKLERFIRDWGLSEQEFRTAGERASEGRAGAALGWGALGLAGAIPVVGQAGRGLVKGVGAAGRAAGAAADVGRGIPAGRWVENPTAETLPVNFVERFSEFDRGARPTTSNIDELAESIRTRGFDDALILEVDPAGRAVLIEGNHRLAAARLLGLEEVPVRVITTGSGRLGERGAEVGVREGLGSGNLLKPSEAIADTAADAGRGTEILRAAKPFDAVEAGFEYGGEINRALRVDDVPEVMYHVAPRSVRESISSSGLVPQETWNTGVGRWPGMTYADDAVRTADTLEPSVYRPDGVYMFENIEDAREFMSGRVPMDVYEVRTGDIARDGGQIIRDPESVGRFAVSENAFVTRLAPPSYISRIDEGASAADVGRAAENLRAATIARATPKQISSVTSVGPLPNRAKEAVTQQSRTLNSLRETQLSTMHRLTPDNLEELRRASPAVQRMSPDNIWVIHETSFPPSRSGGDIVLRPTADYVPETGRHSVHFSLNHSAAGHEFRQGTGARYVVAARLSDVLEANPGSLDNLYSVDTFLTPRPGEGLRIPNATVLEDAQSVATQQAIRNLIEESGGVAIAGGPRYSPVTGVDVRIRQLAKELNVPSLTHDGHPLFIFESNFLTGFGNSDPNFYLPLMSNNARLRVSSENVWTHPPMDSRRTFRFLDDDV